jgi:hypothetical protein
MRCSRKPPTPERSVLDDVRRASLDTQACASSSAMLGRAAAFLHSAREIATDGAHGLHGLQLVIDKSLNQLLRVVQIQIGMQRVGGFGACVHD